MSYKSQLKRLLYNIKALQEEAITNGWKSGFHISKYLPDYHFRNYMEYLGMRTGMRKARKLTLAEVKRAKQK